MSLEVDAEAIRIWMLPRDAWKEELLQLPKERKLNNVLWPFRLAVGMRLKMAENLERCGCHLAGWPQRPADPVGDRNGASSPEN